MNFLFRYISSEDDIIKDFNWDTFSACFQVGPVSENMPNQVYYLFNYLQKLNCQSMVFEENYTDRMYLIDYQNFYSS